MNDATVKFGFDGTQVESGLSRLRGKLAGFGSGIGGLLVGAGAVAGMTSLVRRGLEFNMAMKDGEQAVAKVLKNFQQMSNTAAKKEAAKAMEAIAILEPKAAGGLTDLVDGFLGTLATSQSLGISVEDNIDLVGRFANTLGNLRIDSFQLLQEMRSIMTGNIGADSTVAKALGITPQDIKKATEAGNLVEFIRGKLGTMGEAGDSASVAMSSLNSAIDKTAGLLTSGLFDEGVEGAKNMALWLDTNKRLFQDLGEGIGNTLKLFGGWASKYNEARTIVGEGLGTSIGNMLGFGQKGYADSHIKTGREAADEKAWELKSDRIAAELEAQKKKQDDNKPGVKPAEAKKKAELTNDEISASKRAAATIADEIKLLNLRAAGRKREADLLEKEIKLYEASFEIKEKLKVTDQESMTIAKDLERARQRADERDPETGRMKKIRGYDPERQNPSGGFAGLDAYQRLQNRDRDPFNGQPVRQGERVNTPGLDRLRDLQDRSKPAFSRGAGNAAASGRSAHAKAIAAKRSDSMMSTSEKILERIAKRLEEG